MSVTIAEAAAKRAERAEQATRSSSDKLGRTGQAFRATPPDGIDQMRRSAPLPAEMRAERVQKAGKDFLQITGYATVYETGYEMWDWAGPYTEIVSASAGSATLARNPNVVCQVNHGGWPFARTTAGTLDLSEDDQGLLTVSRLNPERRDAQDLYLGVDDKAINEMSFMFSITRGQWSPDYTEYRINEYDLERGDISPVTYGANPHTSIEARAAQFELRAEVMRALQGLDDDTAAAARGVLAERIGAELTASPAGIPVVGARAGERLRHLRASVEQGALGDVERAEIAAILQRAAAGDLTGVLAGDGPLAVLLGVTTPAPTPATVPDRRFAPRSLDFLEADLNAVRELA